MRMRQSMQPRVSTLSGRFENNPIYPLLPTPNALSNVSSQNVPLTLPPPIMVTIVNIIPKPLITLSLTPTPPPITKPQIPSNLKTLTLKKLHSLSDGGGGGLQDLLCSTTINAAVSASRAKVSPFLTTLASNPTFVSGLVAWALAQSVKVLLNLFVERRLDLGMLFNSGGMPSSHSALCTALTTSVALVHGVGDSLFPVCLGFSLIVMYDAIGVRRHAGMQAQVLNKIIEDLFQGHPISQRKLKELLGHTPSQVVAGAILGIVVACVCCRGIFAI